jgi:alkanesulfonate monooxygenase SsuD/methylene tetrahydromethanopterin reductase-like flavin-dependent oxidoreductase (luciferase family)
MDEVASIGGGEQLTLQIVAKYADIWNFTGGPVDTFKHKVAILHEHCTTVDRTAEEIGLSMQVTVSMLTLMQRYSQCRHSWMLVQPTLSSICATPTRSDCHAPG